MRLTPCKARKRNAITVTSQPKQRVMLSFVDTGPGFADLIDIFDPFFTTKMPGKGTAPGPEHLLMGCLKQHGGNITAHDIGLPVAMSSSSCRLRGKP